MPGVPSIVVEAAIGQSPTAESPTWTDLSSRFRGLSTRRGKQHELDRTEPGSGTLRLDNADGALDPENTAGPYAGDLRPMMRVRVKAVWNSVTYPILDANVEDWPPTYIGQDYAEVQLTLVEGLAALTPAVVTLSQPSELMGDRVNAVLDAVDWPASRRDIGTGSVMLPEQDLVDASALQHLFAVQEVELGHLYYSADGDIVFQDRDEWYGSPIDFEAVTWGDDPSELPYDPTSLGIELTVRDVVNDVSLTRIGPLGVEQRVDDATSISRYFLRTMRRTDVLLTTDGETLDLAYYFLNRLAEPRRRVSGFRPQPKADDSWADVLSLDVGSRLQVRKRPPAGDTIERRLFVEGIEHDLSPPVRWITTLRTSPIEGSNDFWRVGHAEYGVLGQTTRLGL
jgi:hypothetical protein